MAYVPLEAPYRGQPKEASPQAGGATNSSLGSKALRYKTKEKNKKILKKKIRKRINVMKIKFKLYCNSASRFLYVYIV